LTAHSDPDREDARLVWAALRESGFAGATVAELASSCFPYAVDGPPSSVAMIRKRSVARVLGAVVWLRSRGAAVYARSYEGDLTRFTLLES
jgi:hypothetical protein